ncbi:MAG TPA: sigma-70 family RNA polymerase sigma factor [Woeseiaceae bacterium]|nr:sigma-70 family RNA polymerase sigma factor [Woeseiaceae bacterium]
MSTDEELVAEVLRGSASSFNRLVERYQERLLRFLLTRSASRADAEDALQDSFVNAYRYLQSYDPRWRFSTWLYRIAIRCAARNTREEGQSDPEDSAELPGDAPDPLEECILASERENLWLLAKRLLSQEAYAAMWLRYAEDMPVKEVARALGRPQSWTRVVLLRARRRLAGELNDDNASGKETRVYG